MESRLERYYHHWLLLLRDERVKEKKFLSRIIIWRLSRFKVDGAFGYDDGLQTPFSSTPDVLAISS